jgi:hypothetical protein
MEYTLIRGPEAATVCHTLQECVDTFIPYLREGICPFIGIYTKQRRIWSPYGPPGVIQNFKRFAHENNVRLPEDFFPDIDKAPPLI